MALPPFSKHMPNKISDFINVSEKNTLIMAGNGTFRVAIGNEPIFANMGGNNMFCFRVDHAGAGSNIMIGFTPMRTFDSTKEAFFGCKEGFTGCGLCLSDGNLHYPGSNGHKIIDKEISFNAKEIIVILTIGYNGATKGIRFLCDGKESKSTDVSEILKGDRISPAICLADKDQQVTEISFEEIETRTPAVENLKAYLQRYNPNPSGVALTSAMIQLEILRQKEIREKAVLSSQYI